MAILNVNTGAAAKAIHVQQIINWLRGIPAYSEPVAFTGISSPTNYALNVANIETSSGLGQGLRVWNSAISVPLLLVDHNGVKIRPNTNTQGYNFTVRNFADDTDLFKVTESGVTFSGVNPVTTTGMQTLTNKTLTSPIITTPIETTPVITDYITLSQHTVPGTPGASSLFLYFLTSTNDLRYKAGTATERVIVDTSSTQTIGSGKTINAATLTTPVVSDYLTLTQNAAPGTPGASALYLYFLSAVNDLRYKAGNGTERILVDTTSAQTLGGKTLTSPTVTGITVSDNMTFTQATAAGTPGATSTVLYAKTGTTDLRYKASASATEHVLVDADQTQTLSAKTLTSPTINTPTVTSPLVTNYEDYAQTASTPGTPGATKGRLWLKTDNNAYINIAGIDQQILTSANTTIPASTSIGRPMMLGVL